MIQRLYLTTARQRTEVDTITTWPFKTRIRPWEHPMWSAEGMRDTMRYSSQFDCPSDIILTSVSGNYAYVTDPYNNNDNKIFCISSCDNDKGPDTILHSGVLPEDEAFGFIRRNRDGTKTRQVLGIRISHGSPDLLIQPRTPTRVHGWQEPPFHYKHIGIESQLTSYIFRTRTHSFRQNIPNMNGLKEVFIWKPSCGAQVKKFRQEMKIECERNWKLVRAATNDIVAVYMSDWTRRNSSVEGYFRFRRHTVDLGKEFQLIVLLSVLAVIRNERF